MKRGALIVLLLAGAYLLLRRSLIVNHSDLSPLVAGVLAEQGAAFDVSDILALIEVESGGNPYAVGDLHLYPAIARGLMQIRQPAADQVGFAGSGEELFDPLTNIRVGVAYLGWVRGFLSARLGRAPTMSEILMGYNSGVGNVLKGTADTAYVWRWTAARQGVA